MEFAEATVFFEEHEDRFVGEVCVKGGWVHCRNPKGVVESHPPHKVRQVLWDQPDGTAVS